LHFFSSFKHELDAFIAFLGILDTNFMPLKLDSNGKNVIVILRRSDAISADHVVSLTTAYSVKGLLLAYRSINSLFM
tara:strand:- start:169 stop:399 length:231 start_codon:yes stop_codon:yes gene_type:complete